MYWDHCRSDCTILRDGRFDCCTTQMLFDWSEAARILLHCARVDSLEAGSDCLPAGLSISRSTPGEKQIGERPEQKLLIYLINFSPPAVIFSGFSINPGHSPQLLLLPPQLKKCRHFVLWPFWAHGPAWLTSHGRIADSDLKEGHAHLGGLDR